MGQMIISLTVLMSINVMLVLGGFSFSSDLTSSFYNLDDDNRILGYGKALNDSIPKSVLIVGQSEGGGEANPSDFRITDVPKTLFEIFLFLLDVMFAPVALLMSPIGDNAIDLPTEIRFMLAAPLGIIYLFLIIGWWRGTE